MKRITVFDHKRYGTSTMLGNVSVTPGATRLQDTTIAGNLRVANITNGSSAVVVSNLVVTGAFSAPGLSGGDVQFANATVSQTLTTGTIVAAQGNLVVRGNANVVHSLRAGNLYVAGTFEAPGFSGGDVQFANAIVTQTLTTGTIAAAQGNLVVRGDANVVHSLRAGNLYVAGRSRLRGFRVATYSSRTPPSRRR